METKHTPGPWNLDKRQEKLMGANGQSIVVWNSGLSFGNRTEETEANARLIAAAPELLAESKENVRILENLISDLERIAGNPVIEGLRKRFAATIAAIAKAEGR